MLRAFLAAFVCLALLSACGSNAHSKEEVEQAIRDRLQSKSGLDLKTLDVNTTAVTFDKNMAFATVSFHPKDDPSLNSAMVMKYTLERQSGKWVITKVGDTHGNSIAGHANMGGSSTLPPGHPSVGNMPQPAPGGNQ